MDPFALITIMELLGDSNQHLRKMRAQLTAQQALLTALIMTLDEPQKSMVARHFQCESERLMADLLHSMASDSLNELLQSQLQRFAILLQSKDQTDKQAG